MLKLCSCVPRLACMALPVLATACLNARGGSPVVVPADPSAGATGVIPSVGHLGALYVLDSIGRAGLPTIEPATAGRQEQIEVLAESLWFRSDSSFEWRRHIHRRHENGIEPSVMSISGSFAAEQIDLARRAQRFRLVTHSGAETVLTLSGGGARLHGTGPPVPVPAGIRVTRIAWPHSYRRALPHQ